MSSEFLVRIPLERIAVLIGPKGSTKKRIEELTDTKLIIDSQSGDVIIVIEEEELEDPISLWKSRDMVKAIGRGFSPQKTFQICTPGYGFDLLQLRDFVGTSPNAQREVRARIIGKKGRTRNIIEQTASCYISVFGNTVAIIAEQRSMQIIREGLIKLINGSKQSTVYKYLEDKMRELKGDKDKLWVAGEREEDMVDITDLDELERLIFEEEENQD
ncbi:RNA-processing protein [Candidatus Heimdallarchaeota archaeon]|nr:MAG: RNA-processing protein [Candidatus Heimdallarchaeota archaeon]